MSYQSKPKENQSMVDVIHRAVLQRIRLRQYPPATRVLEATLAAEFGVSRTPVREALNRLHHLGLVQTKNGIGTVVVQLSMEELSHIYQMRIEICSLIGRMSPNEICVRHIRHARSLLDQMTNSMHTLTIDGYFRINEEINSLVKSVIGNPALRSTWDFLHSQASSAWHLVDVSEAAVALEDELSDMVTALEYRDPDAVGSVQRIHIGYGFIRLKRVMSSPRTSDTRR